MKKICMGCGAKTSHLDMPLEIVGGQVLCRDCAGDIVYDINKVYKNMSEDEFVQIRTKIINDCRNRLNQHTQDFIVATLNKKYYGEFDTKRINSTLQSEVAKKNDMSYTSNNNATILFENIGGKIKALAQVITWIGIIASLFTGMTVIAIDDEMAFVGMIIMIFGPLASWVSSLVLYGFGQLVENTDKLVTISKQ